MTAHHAASAVAACLLAAALTTLGCASAPAEVIFDLEDPSGDVRLTHPPQQGIQDGTFDLDRATLVRRGDRLIAELTFGAPVRVMRGVRLSEDRVRDVWPQSVDIYLDTLADAGAVETLPGRDFHVPAAEAWDRVLAISAIDDLTAPGLVRPLHVVTRGRQIVATFDARDVHRQIRGGLVVVLAASARGTGRVRPVRPALGDCHVWDDDRCTLTGTGPPVLDSTSQVVAGRPVALTYAEGERPRPRPIPVVFHQGELVSASPVVGAQLVEGALATVVDAAGEALATAVVLSVVGDVASLRLVGPLGGVAAGVVPIGPSAP